VGVDTCFPLYLFHVFQSPFVQLLSYSDSLRYRCFLVDSLSPFSFSTPASGGVGHLSPLPPCHPDLPAFIFFYLRATRFLHLSPRLVPDPTGPSFFFVYPIVLFLLISPLFIFFPCTSLSGLGSGCSTSILLCYLLRPPLH